MAFIRKRHLREVHVADFENGFFLKNVCVNNGLMLILLGDEPAISVTFLRVSLFALDWDQQVLMLRDVCNGYPLIRNVIYGKSICERNMFLAGYDKGSWRQVALCELDWYGLKRAFRAVFLLHLIWLFFLYFLNYFS